MVVQAAGQVEINSRRSAVSAALDLGGGLVSAGGDSAGPENRTHHGRQGEASAAGLCPEPRPKVWVIDVLQFSDQPVDAH